MRAWREVSLEQFLVDDDHVCWRTRACGHWRVPGGLAGVFCFAPQGPEDLEETWSCLSAFHHPWRYVADARRFRADGSPARLFDHMLRRGPAMAALLRPKIDRGALILPADWTVAWWLGATHSWSLPSERMVQTPREAFEFVDEPALGDAVEALTQQLTAEHDVLDRAESIVQREPSIDLDALARRLGLSRRSLQRELARARRTFADLRDRVRFARAEELVRSSDSKIESIALEVGFRSRAHFATWFRARSGRSPVELRRAR